MIEKLEMFIALASEQHFGRAAERCGVTQPSLSSGIKQLEAELGVQLVWRGARFQSLTPEGARVLEWARRIVGDARSLREEMRVVRRGLSGNLRLGVVPTALTVVADLTAPYLARNPNVRLSILSRTSAEIMAEIDNLELDAGITYLNNEPVGRMTAIPLYTEGYCLLVGANTPFAQMSAITWSDMADVPLCLLTTDMQNRRIVGKYLLQAGVTTQPGLDSNSILTLVSHVLKGPWCSIIPDQTAALFQDDPRLVAVPISGASPRHQVGLIAPWREPHTPVLAALLDAGRKIARA